MSVAAGRDVKGLVFQLLLPVAAICLVLAILKVNIDPTSPSVTLRFAAMLQVAPVLAANLPPSLGACAVAPGASHAAEACGSGLLFRYCPSVPSRGATPQHCSCMHCSRSCGIVMHLHCSHALIDKNRGGP